MFRKLFEKIILCDFIVVRNLLFPKSQDISKNDYYDVDNNNNNNNIL